ncbi:ATP-dependent RNA helicase MSS116 [Nemania sp. NC0429]|nr:ATP-dependent RNA helicase MSS116 [Nemania sp. NC0429]
MKSRRANVAPMSLVPAQALGMYVPYKKLIQVSSISSASSSISRFFIRQHNFTTITPTLTRNLPILSDLNEMTTRRDAKTKQPAKWRNRGGSAQKLSTQATRHTNPHNDPDSPSVGQTLTGSSVPSTIPEVSSETQKFSDLSQGGLVHPTLLRTITEDLKFEHMSPVQAATIRPILTEHVDILAQAKTGTGKTVAFLLPAIQKLVSRNIKPGSAVSLLVITPTRELAMQISIEARALLQRLPQYRVCTAIGGTNKDAEETRILKGCDVLIATPGRLIDHLGTDSSLVVESLQQLDTLVLDEADRLLDMGFYDSLRRIVGYLPNRAVKPRQGMLFSATVPEYVQKVSGLVLSKEYKYISTIQKGDINTHEHVPQHLITVPDFSDMAAALVGALRQERSEVGAQTFKTIVFAPTAGLVDFYAEVLQQLPDMPSVLYLHSRMTQSKRTRVTEQYRQAQSGILIATDIIARGMDFPAVTNVFQVGIPSDKESYVHRLGRTARAGAEGKGTFIVTAHETWFPKSLLKDIAFNEGPADLTAANDIKRVAQQMDSHRKIYQAWLGYYKAYMKPMRWDAVTLVAQANKFALEGLCAPEVPGLEKSVIGKMGLKGVKGLTAIPNAPRQHVRTH